MTANKLSMDIHEILDHLPHRYPFILVDRVISMELGKEIMAIKNVTINEPYFPGHFSYHPVMPGVLIVEALAQAAALLSFKIHIILASATISLSTVAVPIYFHIPLRTLSIFTCNII